MLVDVLFKVTVADLLDYVIVMATFHDINDANYVL